MVPRLVAQVCTANARDRSRNVGKSLATEDSIPLAKGLRRRRHPPGKFGHGLVVRNVRPGHQRAVEQRLLKGRLKAAPEAIERVPRRQLPNPSNRRTEGRITSQECIRSLPSIFRRLLHDLGEPMISLGVTIFPNLHHVLHEQLGLCRATGLRRPHRWEEPLEFSRDYSCH